MKSQRKAPTPEWEDASNTLSEAEGCGEIPKESTYAREREDSSCARKPFSPDGYRLPKRIVREFGGQCKLMRVEFHKEIQAQYREIYLRGKPSSKHDLTKCETCET